MLQNYLKTKENYFWQKMFISCFTGIIIFVMIFESVFHGYWMPENHFFEFLN